MYRDREFCKYCLNRSIRAGSNDLEWPRREGCEVSKFSEPTVWARATKFGMITVVVKGRVSSGSDTSHRKGAGNSVLKTFGPLLRTYSSQIWHGNTWRHGRVSPGVRNAPYIKGEAFPKYFIGNTDARRVWPRATKFGMITRGIGVFFSSDQWRPVLKKRRGPVPKNS